MHLRHAVARCRTLAGGGVVAMAAATVVQAASLQVSPTTLSLQPRQNAEGLWLSNTGSELVHAQVRVYRWTQADGEDTLEATRDLVVSPPLLQLPAGEQQLVRVIRLGAPPTEAEASYRVLVDELPVPASDKDPSRPGLQFVLRYSIPVFLWPAVRGTAPPDSAARPAAIAPTPRLQAALLDSDARAQLQINNDGTGHAQIADLVFVDAAGRRHVLREGLAGYVLPGQHRRWPLPATMDKDSAPTGVFKARINGETAERALPSAAAAAPPSGPR